MYELGGKIYLIPLFAFLLLIFSNVPNSLGGALPCGDPQCDVDESTCVNNCSSGPGQSCKWCQDSLPGDRCVADFVECSIPEPSPTPTPGPVEAVPTLSEWGMIFTTIILGFLAVYMLARRKDSSV